MLVLLLLQGCLLLPQLLLQLLDRVVLLLEGIALSHRERLLCLELAGTSAREQQLLAAIHEGIGVVENALS